MARHAEGHRTTLRLIGHRQAASLEAWQAHREGNGSRTVLDLDEVTLVDLEAVRFLGDCETAGMTVLHGLPSVQGHCDCASAMRGQCTLSSCSYDVVGKTRHCRVEGHRTVVIPHRRRPQVCSGMAVAERQ
jgi:hypothetical protein